ncbi:MAG: glycosyltransferase family 4 protein [Candidatus Zixiibacteriota bacterium]|nr:MAG: glycosyltransferase family 4 protein [candidate division Zixibacteria bacterium]
MTNAVWDYINMAYPPHLPSICHVVLDSSACNQLSLRTGISATIIPNVMDFDNPLPAVDDYSADIRQAFEMSDDQLLILQPTRVVKRKGIEHAIELVKRLGMKAKLVITHASGDEGDDYEVRVKEYAEIMNVDVVFESDIIRERRGVAADGKKIYSWFDVYPHTDLVTYPSSYEGFGNAFLEAIYFSKPIVANSYSIFETDIKPKSFKVIELPGYVNEDSLDQGRENINN